MEHWSICRYPYTLSNLHEHFGSSYGRSCSSLILSCDMVCRTLILMTCFCFFVVRSICCCFCCTSCWCYNPHAECAASGRTHHLLPEPQSSWILPVPFGCWSSNLLDEGQRGTKDSCGSSNNSMELLGSLSTHEHCRQPKEKGSGALSCLPHVCFCWLPHNCNKLRVGWLLSCRR